MAEEGSGGGDSLQDKWRSLDAQRLMHKDEALRQLPRTAPGLGATSSSYSQAPVLGAHYETELHTACTKRQAALAHASSDFSVAFVRRRQAPNSESVRRMRRNRN